MFALMYNTVSCQAWTQRASACTFLMQISSKYCILGLTIVPPLLVTNIFPCNWFNSAFYIFDHTSWEPRGMMCVGHSWYFMNWSEPVNWRKWCGITFPQLFGSDFGILYYLGRKIWTSEQPVGTICKLYWHTFISEGLTEQILIFFPIQSIENSFQDQAFKVTQIQIVLMSCYHSTHNKTRSKPNIWLDHVWSMCEIKGAVGNCQQVSALYLFASLLLTYKVH